MTKLTANEHEQNEKFLNEFLAAHYSAVIFPETLKKQFLEKCYNEGIWLRGLSPIVKKPFVQALTLAIQDTQHSIEFKMDKVFKVLRHEVAKERAYLKWQFEQYSQYKTAEQHTLSWHLAHNKKVSVNYWLQTEDMLNVLAPLSHYEGIYVHTQPVRQVGAAVLACINEALTINKAKAAYVPVESGGHWTVEIFTQQNGQLVQEHYNPPGDGKCGDHAASYIYNHAQQFLNAAAKKDLQENFGDYVTNPSTNPTVVRQQTISLIKKDQRLTEQQDNKKQTTYEVATTHENMSAATKPKTQTSIKESHSAEYHQLFKQWNALANHVIDEIQHYSDTERAKLWDSFFNDAVDNVKNNSWSPVKFSQYQQCAKEALKEDDAELAHTIEVSRLVF